MKKLLLLLFSLVVNIGTLFSQCGTSTPVFYVDLSADPNATWLSPSIARDDTCCGSSGNCIQFIVTLNPLAEGVIFDVVSGALPGGALFYQIDCGPPTNIGQSICLSGSGPHSITFCKPGNNENVYAITSIAEPEAGPDVVVTEGCSQQLTSIGFEPSTILWRSIYPGTIGDYNYLLNCVFQCDTVTVTSTDNLPPYIDYQICGFALGLCESIGICDTVRVYFNDSLAVSIEPENPMVCYGTAQTSISANATNGTPPYYYLWSTGETSQSIDVTAGSYSVMVSDSGGCYSQTSNVVVGEFLQEITADAGPDQLRCNQNPVVQLSGSVFGVSTGVWKGGSGQFLPDRNDLNAQYTPSNTEISNGFIDLLLLTTNTSNCLPDSDVVRISFTGFIGDISIMSDSVSCFESTDGYAEINISNGFQTYNYLWDDPTNSTGNAASNLAPGIYNVMVTDSLGCDTTVSVSIEEPDEMLIYAINSQNISCFGDSSGQATLYVSGGNGYYTYNWGIEASFQQTQTATNLGANTYYPVVEDLKGCSDDTTLIITQPLQLELSVDTIIPILCYNDSTGSISVNAAGGNSPYLFGWSSNANYQVGPTASNLGVGVYRVIVVDSYACQDTLEITLTQPTELTGSISVLQDVLCFGDSNGIAEIAISGGIMPYTILWDSTANDQNTAIATQLPSAFISVMVSDSNNCEFNDQVFISQPDSALLVEAYSSEIDCFGNANALAGVDVFGGTAPYTYLWSPTNETSSEIDNLGPGQYSVLISDAHDCVDSSSFLFTEPSLLSAQVTSTPVVCFGDSNGSATLVVSGGTPPYTYQWNDPALQDNAMATDLAPGSYMYIIYDSNLCADSGYADITEPSPILIQSSNDLEVCVDELVELSAQASGGVGPLAYFWSNGLGLGQTQTISAYDDITYYVQAFDSLGCSSGYDSVFVGVKNIYLDSLFVFNGGAICLGESSSIEAGFNGQDPPYSYMWNDNLGNSFGPIQVSPADSTWYTFTVTDQCNNSLSDSTLVAVYPLPILNISLSQNEGCSPLEVDFSIDASQEDLSYIWLFGDGGASIEASPSYTYEDEGQFLVELEVFTTYGCSVNSANNTFVNVLAAPIADFTANPQITEINDADIEFTNTSSADAMFFTWSFGDGDSIMIENPSHTYTNVGEYPVVLITENLDGCISSISKIITINPNHDIIVPNAFTPNINGPADGYYDPNDLSNDVFYPFADYVGEFSMMIFNRWGELIFVSDDIAYGWNGYYKGKISENDSYVYKIEITFLDGYTSSLQGQVKIIN
jgi:gliding motility-associated-like protein